MSKTYHSANRWALAGLFKRINLGEDPKQLCSEASHLVEKVDSDDIVAAQKTLIDEGYSEALVQKIAAAFILMGLPKKETASPKLKLADNHILQKMASEHSMCRCYLQDLKQISDEINQVDTISTVTSEFRRLTLIIDYFHQFIQHIEREEDIIYPCLRKFGWQGLSKTASDEHEKIRSDIDTLFALVSSFEMLKPNDFKVYLRKITNPFISAMQQHLSYEEELLWPISLVVIDDAQVWQAIKEICDEFEY